MCLSVCLSVSIVTLLLNHYTTIASIVLLFLRRPRMGGFCYGPVVMIQSLPGDVPAGSKHAALVAILNTKMPVITN